MADPAQAWEKYTDLTVGEVLRRARMQYGLSIDDVAKALRIRASQLGALEDNRPDLLPGRVYAIGFVRAYAEYLALDGDKMVHLFKAQSGGGNRARPRLTMPLPASESRAPTKVTLAGSLGVLVVLVVVLIAFNARHRPAPEFIPPVPGTLSIDVTRLAVPPLADAFAQTAATVEDAQPLEMTRDAASPATPNAAPLPLQVATAVALNPSARVVLQARDSVWLEIRDPAGHVLLSRILKPGDAYDVPDQTGLKLDVGNAGAIAILVDGQSVAPLGQVGDVRRGVLLDPDALKSGGTNTTAAAVPASKARKLHVKKLGGDAFTGTNDHYAPNSYRRGAHTPYYNE